MADPILSNDYVPLRYRGWVPVAPHETEPTRPPLGVQPRYVWENRNRRQRISDILDAIERYNAVRITFPRAWMNELQQHIDAIATQSPKET